MATDNVVNSALPTPNIEQLAAIATKLGFDIPREELNEYKELVTSSISIFNRLEELAEPTLPVKYPRTPGIKPAPEENPYNAWFYKTDICGADDGILAGKSIAIKDVIPVAGVPLSNGSRLLRSYVPDFDATVVTRVLDSGARIAGKSNCADFCISGCSFSSAHGAVQNPHAPGFSAGGSSSGSAALVAGGVVDLALGTDQGGSIRVPAAFCGIVGLKPTFGLVPYTGIGSLDASVDHVGPMAKTVYECALLLEAIAGEDDLDQRQPRDLTVPKYTSLLTDCLNGLRIGVLVEGFTICEPEVAEIVRREVLRLRDRGATVEDVHIPMHTDGLTILSGIVYNGFLNVVQSSGCNIGLRGFHPTGMHDAMMKALKPPYFNQISPSVKQMCLVAAYAKEYCGLRYYAKGHNLTRSLAEKYNAAMKYFDVLVLPTAPCKANRLPVNVADMSVTDYQNVQSKNIMANTAPFNATGHPAISINAGCLDGLPVGMMIVGRHYEDEIVLKVAYAYEKMQSENLKS